MPPYGGGNADPFADRRDVPPYGAEQSPYHREQSPYAREQSPYGQEQTPYGGEQAPPHGREQYGQQQYGQEQAPYAREPEGWNRVDEISSSPDAVPGPGPGRAPGWDARRAPATPRVPPPPEPEWDPYSRGPWWRHPLALGVALLLLIGALFFGLWYAARNEKPPVAAPTPAAKPSPPASQGPLTKYGYAASRATDKSLLSLKELFGKKKIVKDKRSYVRTVTRKEKKCADGVTGAKITKALKAAGCTQLLRASFADAKGTIIGTVGVANLRTSAAAKKVASAGGGGERKDYLKPLPGKDEATKHLGTGDAYAGGWTYGHYALLLWFQFKDGHKPTKTELKRLYQAAVDVTDTTVYPALDTRALTGGHR